VVLIIIDTLRADVLGCYGSALDTLPEIDAFAARGVRFENVFAPTSWTRPSIGAMLTGRYPRSLGIYAKHEWVHTGRRSLTRPEYSSVFAGSSNARYLAALRQISADLGAFVDRLRSRPGWGDVLFIFTSDHGEGGLDGIRTSRFDSESATANAMAVFLYSWEQAHPRAETTAPRKLLTEEEIRQLKALGYLQ
jgi:arylsulfatase A-like enzyme